MQPELLELLQEWRRLTELETAAIHREDWARVAEHQGRKGELQEAITHARRRQDTQPASLPNRAEAANPTALVAELLALEQRNAAILAAKRRQRQEDLLRVRQANHQLHGLRRAYGNGSRSCWQSYS